MYIIGVLNNWIFKQAGARTIQTSKGNVMELCKKIIKTLHVHNSQINLKLTPKLSELNSQMLIVFGGHQNYV